MNQVRIGIRKTLSKVDNVSLVLESVRKRELVEARPELLHVVVVGEDRRPNLAPFFVIQLDHCELLVGGPKNRREGVLLYVLLLITNVAAARLPSAMPLLVFSLRKNQRL